jgi:hypothetical protein
MARIEHCKERYLHCPRLVARAEGGATLHAIAWEGDSERIWSMDISEDGSFGVARTSTEKAARIVTLTRGDYANPTDDDEAEQRESRAGFTASVQYDQGVSTVWLETPKGERVQVFRAFGAASNPALALAQGGIWVAFHHDVREDAHRPDVAKWIALRFVTDDGEVLMPSASMKERDRDLTGAEQSFEFPALVVSADGSVALFGRGSHNYWRQDLSQQGFSSRTPLSDGEWGSRGRHIVALAIEAGIVVARRDRKGLEIDILPHATGGSPALMPAIIERERCSALAAGDRVDRARDPARIHGRVTLFGDIQQHSAHSDGIGSAQEVYVRARHRYGDDFVALTDHEAFLGKRTSPGEWEYLQSVADRFDEPRVFSALYAYEWTGKMFPGPGHKCVYYPRRGLPIISRDDVPEGRELVARVRELGGFASPHHIGWTGADEAGHDDFGQPLWEICSCHGCYEHVDHPLGQRGTLRDQMADQMLQKGHRFGFTASSDSHGLLWHHGEARKRDPYRTGLTAVQATSCTREAILEALQARRCYATSGVKILLDVSADGLPMGSDLPAQTGATLKVHALGTAEIATIEVVTNDGVVASNTYHEPRADLEVRVSGRFAYARITQKDGEMAWSSPVFFGPR